ncbi:MAG: hypothetical protein ACRDMU_02950 [Gaiellaceae bacterium]
MQLRDEAAHRPRPAQALDVLAWEAVATLAILVVLAPFALVAAAVWATRHVRRRREEERLLAAS